MNLAKKRLVSFGLEYLPTRRDAARSRARARQPPRPSARRPSPSRTCLRRHRYAILIGSISTEIRASPIRTRSPLCFAQHETALSLSLSRSRAAVGLSCVPIPVFQHSTEPLGNLNGISTGSVACRVASASDARASPPAPKIRSDVRSLELGKCPVRFGLLESSSDSHVCPVALQNTRRSSSPFDTSSTTLKHQRNDKYCGWTLIRAHRRRLFARE